MIVTFLLASMLAVVAAPPPRPPAPPPGCLAPPVDAPIVDPFREPLCPWCPGNRGLEYAVPPGTPVRAAGAGVVVFNGSVARTPYLVVDHGDGMRATYGRLASSPLSVGERIAAGAVVGAAGEAFYFGLRRGERYIDPQPLLGRLVERWRLIPIDGSPARPPPPPRWRCGPPPSPRSPPPPSPEALPPLPPPR